MLWRDCCGRIAGRRAACRLLRLLVRQDLRRAADAGCHALLQQ
jgi:hypothetical protein